MRLGSGLCDVPALYAGYFDNQSQAGFVTVYVGHHASLWNTFSSFWSLFFQTHGATAHEVAAGPLGGSAGCGTNFGDSSCAWFDNDTFGELEGDGPSLSQSQTARLMVQFRDAIERPG